jgi:outer membrane lipoprotein LolB
MFYRYFTLGLIALVLTACSRLPQQPAVAVKEQPKLLAQKRFWQAEGKIALSVKEYKESGNFDWQNQGGNFAIRFYGPMGLGAVKLTKEGKQVTFESAKDGTHSAESAEELMQRLAGWQVPISQLQHWIKGIPAPGAIEARQDDAAGQLLQLKQLGWTIDYSAYSLINGWMLPGKLIASREQVRVVMVMKNWQLTAAGE